MLYINILTWAPDKRDAVTERAQKIGFEHEGMKVIGTWIDVDGWRGFQLTEVPPDIDPMLSLKANFAWNDIIKIESVAVMEAEDMLKITASMT
ncbi:DUF3303 domain-containing protein [Chloroflexota bacterium]